MKICVLIFFALCFAATGARAADEIKLKSGKTLTGRITAETAQSYTLRLGPSMYLSVAKNEVVGVTRAQPAPTSPQRTEYRMDPPKPAKPSADASSTTVKSATVTPTITVPLTPATPPSPTPAAQTPGVAPIAREAATEDNLKIGSATVIKKTRFRLYPVTGKTFAEARAAIVDPAHGKGFLEAAKRTPSKTDWSAGWTGTPGDGGHTWGSLIVVATVSVTLPEWSASASAAPVETELWRAYLKDATDHETGHLEIIHDALVSFGESVSNLNEASEADLRRETAALFKAVQAQAAKRRQGFERRENRRPLPKTKKP